MVLSTAFQQWNFLQNSPMENNALKAMTEASATSRSSPSNDQMSSIATTLAGSTVSASILITDVTTTNTNANTSSDTAAETEKGACLDAFMLEHVEVKLEATTPQKIWQRGNPTAQWNVPNSVRLD